MNHLKKDMTEREPITIEIDYHLGDDFTDINLLINALKYAQSDGATHVILKTEINFWGLSYIDIVPIENE